MLKTISNLPDLHEIIAAEKNAGRSIGFVPTMGALHQGHISLIRSSRADGHFTVCSIFVNPTQFNDRNDYLLYPRDAEKDAIMLEAAGCDLLFLPSEETIYPDPSLRKIDFDPGKLALRLEGEHRPGHFAGMTAVVKRLFDLVQPDAAYFGQKDYQQFLVVQKLISHYRMPIKLVMCPIAREDHGLAMSSRNERLNAEDRTRAAAIYCSLQHAKEKLLQGMPSGQIKAEARAELEADRNFTVDYFDICSANELVPLDRYNPSMPVVICTAVHLGGVRLIDNIIVE